MNDIVDMIRNQIIPKDKPAVYISGGLDSTIILHHLAEKCKETIHTYTCKFGIDGDENEDAEKVSEYYGTLHKTVEIKDFVHHLPEILKGFAKPRYNVWVWYMIKEAWKDGRKTGYIGEGADELFGGYEIKKGYLESWADHIIYAENTYKTIHKKFGINLEIPFAKVSWKDTLKYYEPPKKAYLRQAYKDIIPDFILEKDKKPPISNLLQFYKKEIEQCFPVLRPQTNKEIRKIMQFSATLAWLESNNIYYSGV